MANAKFRSAAKRFLAYRASQGDPVAEDGANARMRLRSEINPAYWRARAELAQSPQSFAHGARIIRGVLIPGARP